MPNLILNDDLIEKLQAAAAQANCPVEVFVTSLLDQHAGNTVDSDFQHCLKVIHRASMELVQTETLDALYCRAVEIGLSELGFDRVGFLMLDYESNCFVGTFGTDMDGKVRDETNFRWSMALIDERLTEALIHKDRVIIERDTDLLEFGKPVARGWNALVALWGNNSAIGYLAADNLVHQQPPRPYEAELLSLFSATVGHAINRKRAELDLRASEERFRILFQAAPVAILLVAPGGQILSANGAAEAIFGYRIEEFENITLETLVPEGLRLTHRHHLAHFFEEPHKYSVQMGVGLELRGLRKNGAQFPIDAAISYIEGAEGLLALAFIIDSTERKVVERQQMELALHEERVTIMNAFIRDSAHEFRTPLAIIHSSLYLLGKAADEARRHELSDKIGRQADKILKLVENLSTMVRLENQVGDEAHEVNINSIVLRVVRTSQQAMEEQKLSLWLNLNESTPLVWGIHHDLALALSCLIDNAIQHTAESGSIIIETKIDDAEQVVLSVIDTGSGIPPEIRERIFEQFYRADAAHTTPGLGLGLSIAKKIIDQHHGRIEVESELGHGSTFRIILPALGPDRV